MFLTVELSNGPVPQDCTWIVLETVNAHEGKLDNKMPKQRT